MELFRAVPRSGLVPGKAIGRHSGRRLPSNVPFAVDNLWEFSRPDGMPSRRHAVYASTTPELALQNASADHLERTEYAVCRIEFRETPALIQLSVSDARYHPDVQVLQQCISRLIPRNWGDNPVSKKVAIAPLFLPGVTRPELLEALEQSDVLRTMVLKAASLVTLWTDQALSNNGDGELFFELSESNSYTLTPLQAPELTSKTLSY